VKKAAVSSLRETKAIPRGNVIISNAGTPRGFHDSVCISISNHGELMADSAKTYLKRIGAAN
jgi:hypothetical protein